MQLRTNELTDNTTYRPAFTAKNVSVEDLLFTVILIRLTTSTPYYDNTAKYTLIGINLGLCYDDVPEVYTSLMNADVSDFVFSIAKPEYENNICNEDPDEHTATKAVSYICFHQTEVSLKIKYTWRH